MPKQFIKVMKCGCVIKTSTCGVKSSDTIRMYLLCGHKYITLCETCGQDETMANQVLDDMGYDDNMTDGLGYAEWVELEKKVFE